MSEIRAEFAALVRDVRAHLEGAHVEGDGPPILIVHGDESPAALSLLQNLTQALSNKVAPARLIPAANYTGGNPKLLVATDTALAAKPDLQNNQPFLVEKIARYVEQPALRKGLWDQLKNAFGGAR